MLHLHGCTNPIIVHILIGFNDDGVPLGYVNVKAVNRQGFVADAVHLNDGQLVAGNAESEESIACCVDDSEAITFAFLDIDTSPGNLWATDIATDPIDSPTVSNLSELVKHQSQVVKQRHHIPVHDDRCCRALLKDISRQSQGQHRDTFVQVKHLRNAKNV